jgi:aminodeoxyfutalosine synthase
VTGEQILREIAVGRLLLDNVPHIKAFWVMATPAVAQVAQWYGADDLDGTVLRYEITRGPGKETRQELTVDALTHLIRNASRNPMERDGNYRPISPPPPIPQRP